MSGHEQHREEHQGFGDPSDLERAEKAVADAIEGAIDVPASIEEQALLEAAEIEEIEAG